jgi:hypothetical protein
MDIGTQPHLLGPQGAAEFLGVTAGTLSVWRSTKRYNLPYIKIGSKIRYQVTDLVAFLEARKVTPGEPARRSHRGR